ncbi:hypothetical protein ACP70R_046075 [Stipagrostis hirtigluma subsp. patula]
MFCIINMLNYVDRGAIASNGVSGSRKNCSGGTCTSEEAEASTFLPPNLLAVFLIVVFAGSHAPNLLFADHLDEVPHYGIQKLSELTTEGQTWSIKVKVIRIWESNNLKIDQLMSLDMIVMDE